MISKQGLWFLTLLSLVLVLSVYYITMPNELLLTNNQKYIGDNNTKEVNETSSEVIESDYLTALRVAALDKRITDIRDLHMILTDIKTTTEEKNNAYEKIKYLNMVKGQEESLELKVKDEFKKAAFIKIENDYIKVVIASKDHNKKVANDIMRSIQEEFDSKVYISVKFQA